MSGPIVYFSGGGRPRDSKDSEAIGRLLSKTRMQHALSSQGVRVQRKASAATEYVVIPDGVAAPSKYVMDTVRSAGSTFKGVQTYSQFCAKHGLHTGGASSASSSRRRRSASRGSLGRSAARRTSPGRTRSPAGFRAHGPIPTRWSSHPFHRYGWNRDWGWAHRAHTRRGRGQVWHVGGWVPWSVGDYGPMTFENLLYFYQGDYQMACRMWRAVGYNVCPLPGSVYPTGFYDGP